MTYRNDWINDNSDNDNGIMILELKTGSIEPGPCVDIIQMQDGSWEALFMKRSDIETSDDETLYHGPDEFEVQQWISAAEHVADIYSHGKPVGEDHRVKALYAVVEERCW